MFSRSDWYQKDLEYITNFGINWDKLANTSILVTGATGLIGTVLVDSLMSKNKNDKTNIKVIALSRGEKRLQECFADYYGNDLFQAVVGDVNEPLVINEDITWIVNLASNTHPVLYASQPIGTIDAIVAGTRNILDFGVKCNSRRVLNASSVEIYGENRGDTERFTEEYMGYIDCNTLRAGYPEGKRLSESLSQAYIAEKEIDVVSARFGRVYGAPTLISDTKSTTQFIHSAVVNQNITLKSEGKQEYSFVYVADAVTAILLLLVKGDCGSAYNIANDEIISLREFAKILADINNKKVVFELPSKTEQAGYSVVVRALLDSTKLKSIGWQAKYNAEDGLKRTVNILRDDDV